MKDEELSVPSIGRSLGKEVVAELGISLVLLLLALLQESIVFVAKVLFLLCQGSTDDVFQIGEGEQELSWLSLLWNSVLLYRAADILAKQLS